MGQARNKCSHYCSYFYCIFTVLQTSYYTSHYKGQRGHKPTVFLGWYLGLFPCWLVPGKWIWSQVSRITMWSSQRASLAKSVSKQCGVLSAKNMHSPQANLLLSNGMASKESWSLHQRKRRMSISVKITTHAAPPLEKSALSCLCHLGSTSPMLSWPTSRSNCR